MAKLMSARTYNLYADEIRAMFNPLRNQCHEYRALLAQQARKAVMQELGVYDLVVERAKLQARIAEITEAMKQYTDKTWTDGQYRSQVERAVQSRVDEMDVVGKQISELEGTYLRKVKFAFLGEEMSKMFIEIESAVKELTPAVKKLVAMDKNKGTELIDLSEEI